MAWCSATVGGGPVGGEAVPQVDYEALAYEARASLSLGTPGISMSPSADAPILVRVPVWLWVDDWDAQSATASVPGGSVTVTATPSALSWDMGDGTTVECEGPGTAYTSRVHDPAEESPDCGHTYTSRGDREVAASMAWSIEWSSTSGEGGSLPDLVTTSSVSVRVVESSGVVT
ncbi:MULTISPECIES: hypothetical protein [Nocardiopsis]|uniref:PKD domain-containing protein n=3 Tax=Nocardiopsidaceae TaxID=83676 RepID=A0A840WTE7_9ACTN|nr:MULTISPECIES: hypothetical protein [Nocardiopsis]MBB5493418.1 hypothetical protein [Nocardiopsis metallicus]MCK9873034.1 hypothetical protein [Nocardiopsis dassonvillei]MEE2051630.1 hypothetical protein [Nocardiopsis umidischolae]